MRAPYSEAMRVFRSLCLSAVHPFYHFLTSILHGLAGACNLRVRVRARPDLWRVRSFVATWSRPERHWSWRVDAHHPSQVRLCAASRPGCVVRGSEARAPRSQRSKVGLAADCCGNHDCGCAANAPPRSLLQSWAEEAASRIDAPEVSRERFRGVSCPASVWTENLWPKSSR